MNTVKQSTAYSVVQLGNFKDVSKLIYQPSPSFKIDGKVFLKETLNMTSAEISVNNMAPNAAIDFLHKHKENEEIYIVIKGKGQLLLEGDFVDLEEGTVVRVHTETARAIRNTTNEEFIFIVIQAKQKSLETGTTSDGYAIKEKPNW